MDLNQLLYQISAGQNGYSPINSYMYGLDPYGRQGAAGLAPQAAPGQSISDSQNLLPIPAYQDPNAPPDPNDPSTMVPPITAANPGPAPTTDPSAPAPAPAATATPAVQALLGTQPGTAPTDPAAPAQADAGGDIPVTGPSSMKNPHLPGGFMSVGHTGANILGILGDALLAQGGHAAVYAPKLQQMREAAALQGYDDNPEAALNRWGRLVPGKDFLDAKNVGVDNTRQDALAQATIARQKFAQQQIVRGRAASAAMAANSATWPTMRKQMVNMYVAAGMDPSEIPQNVEDAQSYAKTGIAPKDQVSLQQQADHYKEMEGLAQQRVDSTNDYRSKIVPIRQQTADAYSAGVRAGVPAKQAQTAKTQQPTIAGIRGAIGQQISTKGWASLTPNQQELWNRTQPGGGKANRPKIAVTYDANGNIVLPK